MQDGAREGARAVDLPARSFDLARPGVAPPLYMFEVQLSVQHVIYFWRGRCLASSENKTATVFDGQPQSG